MKSAGGQMSEQIGGGAGRGIPETGGSRRLSDASGARGCLVLAKKRCVRESFLQGRWLTLRGNMFGGALFGLLLFGSPLGLTAKAAQYGYDTMERLTHVGYADGSSLDYVYDALGNRLVKTVTIAGSPSNQPPSVVSNPSIPTGATNVTLTPNLSW